MDVLQPELHWINGICYRINPVKAERFKSLPRDQFADEPGDDFRKEEESCEDDTHLDIQLLEDGRFRLQLPVAVEFYAHVIGSKGATKKRLETEYGVQIRVPKQGQSGDVVITGGKRVNVVSVYNQITLLVNNVRKKLAFTHFLSVPLASKLISENYAQFQEGLRTLKVDEKLLQNSEKLHLTLGTLVLMDDRERKEAASILQDAKKDNLFSEPVEVLIEGLEIMNDDRSAVDVLYAQVKDIHGGNRLQKMATALVDRFVRKGFAFRQFENVKLHMTLLSTTFKDTGNASKVTFDARPILEKFGKFYFGKEIVNVIHLSQRYSTGSDGYYKSTAQLSLLQ